MKRLHFGPATPRRHYPLPRPSALKAASRPGPRHRLARPAAAPTSEDSTMVESFRASPLQRHQTNPSPRFVSAISRSQRYWQLRASLPPLSPTVTRRSNNIYHWRPVHLVSPGLLRPHTRTLFPLLMQTLAPVTKTLPHPRPSHLSHASTDRPSENRESSAAACPKVW
jgi:hypothetical protein